MQIGPSGYARGTTATASTQITYTTVTPAQSATWTFRVKQSATPSNDYIDFRLTDHSGDNSIDVLIQAPTPQTRLVVYQDANTLSSTFHTTPHAASTEWELKLRVTPTAVDLYQGSTHLQHVPLPHGYDPLSPRIGWHTPAVPANALSAGPTTLQQN